MASLGYEATELACAGGTLYWFDEAAHKVMRETGNDFEPVLTVEGDGRVLVRSAGDDVMVALLGEEGSVWLVGSGSERVAQNERVEFAAYGNKLPHWYDGESIRTPGGVTVTPDDPVLTFGVYDEGPVFMTSDRSIYLTSHDQARRIASAPSGYYEETFTIVGATAAWGSRDGLRLLLLSGASLFTFGSDVHAVAGGTSGLFMCDTTESGVQISHIETSGKVVAMAKHASCVSIAECNGYVYWSTDRGNILRAPLDTARTH